MNIKNYLWAFAAALTVGLSSCSDDEPNAGNDVPEPPKPGENTPTEVAIKPKAMWIDCEANFTRLSTKAGIDAELQKIKLAGLNMIYLDVKTANGYALYKSDILPYCNTFGAHTVQRDYDDYLGYFLEKCEELDIDVVASMVALGFGYHTRGVEQGLVYDQWDKWGDMLQERSDNSDPTKVVKITEDVTQPIVMLSPCHKEVQDFVVSLARELVVKYPKLKGISLDYLRYNNNDGGWYGMGDADLNAYAEYLDEPKPERTDIVTATGGVGPKFAKWLEYRSMNVTNLITKIRKAVKEVNPDCEIHLWASAHWESRYAVGQNWASKNYKPNGFMYTDTYSKTGFADQLDVFITGAYSEAVWIKDNPTSVWSVENFCKTWNTYIMDECKCYGSIAAYALTPDQIPDATYLCLKHTDGYMTFELSHINAGNKWTATHKGINRYEKAGQ